MTVSYTLGLNFDTPSPGDTNWPAVQATKDTKVSQHDHTGGGLGTQIATGALAANSVTDTKIRLANNSALRGRNAANNADVDLIKVNTSNYAELPTGTKLASTETLTTASVTSSVLANLTILNGTTSLGLSSNAIQEGMPKVITNINATACVVTPALAVSGSSCTIGQFGWAIYWFMNGRWRCVPGPRCVVTNDDAAFSAAGSWDGFSKSVSCTGTTYTITTPAGVEGQTVVVKNNASGAVTFGGASMATGTYYLYSYLNAGWRRVALT